MTQGPAFTVICCRPDPADPEPQDPEGGADGSGRPGRRDDDRVSRAALSEVLHACAGNPVHYVGRRPGKQIDQLLTGRPNTRLLVVGDDADLAVVVLRLLRTERLALIEVAYASPRRRTPVTDLWFAAQPVSRG